MAELTRERRAFLAECIEGEPDGRKLSGWGIAVSIGELRALLDAADERDRLREAVKAILYSLNDDGEMEDFRPGARERLGKAVAAARLALAEGGR